LKTMEPRGDLNLCTALALHRAVDFLVTERHASRDDAYRVAPVRPGNPLAHGNRGIPMMNPKKLFTVAPAK